MPPPSSLEAGHGHGDLGTVRVPGRPRRARRSRQGQVQGPGLRGDLVVSRAPGRTPAPRPPRGSPALVPAAWLGIDGEVASVEVGKRADLIAMKADPTQAVPALRTLHWVMNDGHVHRNDAWVR